MLAPIKDFNLDLFIALAILIGQPTKVDYDSLAANLHAPYGSLDIQLRCIILILEILYTIVGQPTEVHTLFAP